MPTSNPDSVSQPSMVLPYSHFVFAPLWYKPNCIPESIKHRPTRAHEYVFPLVKSRSYYYDRHAIIAPLSQSSIRRVQQKGFRSQKGGVKDYQHGANSNRSVRRTLENFARNPGSRNKRSVWTILTQPYRDTHFAVFPEELARLCILADCRRGLQSMWQTASQNCEELGSRHGKRLR
jgi:site-specific DNA-methyltransferase (adenine-specific)